MSETDFDLVDFTPYLLAQAAETASLGFQRYYRSRYGMLRTEWRVLFHLGRYGDMTAKEICDRARIHKTKVSRAVAALTDKRFIERRTVESDRRHEMLCLTGQGKSAYRDLANAARTYDEKLTSGWSPSDRANLARYLKQIADL